MSSPQQSRAPLATQVAQMIIAKLAQGVKPWRRTWTGSPVSRPLRRCGTPYTGFNCFWLWMVADDKGYASPTWMTYNQAVQLGGQVRKGEKASQAIFYKQLGHGDSGADDEDDDNHSAGAKSSVRRVAKTFNVFNVDQIDGLPERFAPIRTIAPLAPDEHREGLERFFGALPFIVIHKGNRPCYQPALDIIEMPVAESFDSYSAYAATRLHETGHATGAKHRLNRDFSGRFGDRAYAFEELVAEIFSATMSAELGLANTDMDNHTAYVASWINILDEDPVAILTAAARAEDAVTYVQTLAATPLSQAA